MTNKRLFSVFGALACTASLAFGQPSIAINFGADEPALTGGGTLSATDVAGAAPQANWNNVSGNFGTASDLVDSSGAATSVTITWTSPNTWSSTGRGEENNGLTGGDRALMTGYIDTGADSANTASVTVSGLPAGFTSLGYNVIVYSLGGVAGRGGGFTIDGTTLIGTSPSSPTALTQDAGVDMTDEGTYLVFSGLTGSSFTLTADASLGNFRAPINGIQIVSVPEPSTVALLVLGGIGVVTTLRRRR